MIPESPLNKMVPLMEDHGVVGCMGTPVSSRTNIYDVNFEGHFPVSPGCAWKYLLRLKPLSLIP